MKRLSYSDRSGKPPTRLPRIVELVGRAVCRGRLQPPLRRVAVGFARTLLAAFKDVEVLAPQPIAELLGAAVSCTPTGRGKAVVLWCDHVPETAVFCAGPACGEAKHLRAIRCRELRPQIYLLVGCGVTETVRLSLEGYLEPAGIELGDELRSVLKALREAVRDFGSIKIGDAVLIVSGRLGVKRGVARLKLAELIRLGLVRVVEGYVVEVADIEDPTELG
jgi:predicted RNA-binding Zn-ribbon protein involved in translation (DUF1610 family)